MSLVRRSLYLASQPDGSVARWERDVRSGDSGRLGAARIGRADLRWSEVIFISSASTPSMALSKYLARSATSGTGAEEREREHRR